MPSSNQSPLKSPSASVRTAHGLGDGEGSLALRSKAAYTCSATTSVRHPTPSTNPSFVIFYSSNTLLFAPTPDDVPPLRSICSTIFYRHVSTVPSVSIIDHPTYSKFPFVTNHYCRIDLFNGDAVDLKQFLIFFLNYFGWLGFFRRWMLRRMLRSSRRGVSRSWGGETFLPSFFFFFFCWPVQSHCMSIRCWRGKL